MKAIRVFLLTAWALFLAHSVRAELVIEITQGMDNPTAIAVAPFDWPGPRANRRSSTVTGAPSTASTC